MIVRVEDYAEYFLPVGLENFVVLRPKFFKNILWNQEERLSDERS